MAAFSKRYPGKENEYAYWRAKTMWDMFAAAAKKAQSNDPVKVARALEGMKMTTSLGEVEMRADNHQILQPLFVSTLARNVEVRQRRLGPRLEDRRQDRRQGDRAADDLQDGAAEVTGPATSRRSADATRAAVADRGAFRLAAHARARHRLAPERRRLRTAAVHAVIERLTLIFSMMGVLNFAHASVFMLGAYLSFQLGRWVGFWPALVIAPLLCGVVGAAIERYGLAARARTRHVAEILFTFGLAYLIEELVTMVWGRNAVANAVPAVIDFPLFHVFGSSFPAYKGLMMADLGRRCSPSSTWR